MKNSKAYQFLNQYKNETLAQAVLDFDNVTILEDSYLRKFTKEIYDKDNADTISNMQFVVVLCALVLSERVLNNE